MLATDLSRALWLFTHGSMYLMITVSNQHLFCSQHLKKATIKKILTYIIQTNLTLVILTLVKQAISPNFSGTVILILNLILDSSMSLDKKINGASADGIHRTILFQDSGDTQMLQISRFVTQLRQTNTDRVLSLFRLFVHSQ